MNTFPVAQQVQPVQQQPSDHTFTFVLIFGLILCVIVGCVAYYYFKMMSSTSTSSVVTPIPPPSTTPPTPTPPQPSQDNPAPNNQCIDGDCLVEMENGARKRIRDLKKGDVTSTGAKVVCVITNSPSKVKVYSMYPDGLLRVTKNHPIRLLGGTFWMYPSCNDDYKIVPQVYNLVLDKHHYVTIGAYEVLTLGHNIQDDEIAKHSYFGTEHVINDLKVFSGWSTGFIVLPENVSWKRDENNHVVGMRFV